MSAWVEKAKAATDDVEQPLCLFEASHREVLDEGRLSDLDHDLLTLEAGRPDDLARAPWVRCDPELDLAGVAASAVEPEITERLPVDRHVGFVRQRAQVIPNPLTFGKSILAAATVTVSFLATSTAVAAVTPKWYWTQTRAEARVVAKVLIRDCSVFPDNPSCRPSGLWHVRTADCTGSDELRQTFTYPRFTCEITVTDYYGRPLSKGRIAVYVTGPTAFRWKILD